MASRGDVCLVQLDPTRGSEIKKTRPSLIVSPDELNNHLRTVIIAPMTTGVKHIRGGFSVAFRAEPDLSPRTNFALSMLGD